MTISTIPDMARKAGIEGRVVVQFVVNEDGKAKDPEVLRGIGGGCDEAAVEVIKKAEISSGKTTWDTCIRSNGTVNSFSTP